MKLAYAGILCLFSMSGTATAEEAVTNAVSPNAQIVLPADTEQSIRLPSSHGGVPALPLRGAHENPIGYSLPFSVSTRPANFRNTIGQLTGSLVGSSQAENSRVMFLYEIGNDEEFSKLMNVASSQEGPFLVYVLAKNQEDRNFLGAPVVFLPDAAGSWENSIQDLSQATRLANEAISWGIPKGLSESGALKNDGRLLLAVPAEIPGLPLSEKVFASGSLEWNVYSDVKAITDAAAVATAVRD